MDIFLQILAIIIFSCGIWFIVEKIIIFKKWICSLNKVSKKFEMSYKRKYLLTKNEWSFYKLLKPVADDLGYVVLAKVRLADLVDPVPTDNCSYSQLFAKIKSKHIDFVFCRPDNLAVDLLIELDDSSHEPGNERDKFVETLYKQTGYRLFRTYGNITEEALKYTIALRLNAPV